MISVSPRPWTQRAVNGGVYDAHGRLVSFVENGDFVLHAAQSYDTLVAALRLIERLAAPSTSATDQAITEVARLAIFEADHPQTPAPRPDMPSANKEPATP